MNFKKLIKLWLIFPISLLLLFQPVIGMELNEPKKIKVSGVNNEGYHLETYFNSIKFERYEKINDEYYSIYKAEYEIKNTGDDHYYGQPVTMVQPADYLAPVFDSWEENYLDLDPSESISLSHEIKILNSLDPEKDKERHFADHRIALYATHWDEWPPYPENRILRVKYYNNDSDYTPTLAHLLVSTPWRFTISNDSVNYSEASYLELKDIDELPDSIKSRLGYVKDLSNYLSQINDEIKSIVQKYDELFISEIWRNIKPIILKITDICQYYKDKIDNKEPEESIEILLTNLATILNDNLSLMSNVSNLHYGLIVSEIENLITISSNFMGFMNKTPWKNSIDIKGKLEDIRVFELIKISCRNQDFLFTDKKDGDRDRAVNFDFFVESKPISNEDTYFDLHNCLLDVKGWCLFRRNRIIRSNELFSFCYSNGSIYTTFKDQEWSTNRNRAIPEAIKNIFLSARSNLIKTISDKKSLKEEDKIISKDSNDELIYKEYYPGAPYMPNVIYYGADQLIVHFKSSINVLTLDNVSGYPIVDNNKKLNSVVIEATDVDLQSLIKELEAKDEIVYAELNLIANGCDIIPTDEYWSKQWGHRAINLPEAWELSRGRDVKVAVVDTGVDTCEPSVDIDKSRVVYQHNFIEEGRKAYDDTGHGTHCAGLIMAGLDDGGIAGVAPECKIMPIRVIDRNPGCDAFNIAEGVQDVADKADVICLAIEIYGAPPDTRTLYSAVKDAYSNGAIIVAAVGNKGDGNRISTIASWDETIAVGAVDENFKHCDFSNYHEGIDIVAPGNKIYSTVLEGKYEYKSGTSMATAYVAGVAALYSEKYPNTSPSQFKKMLIASAKDLGKTGWDEYYGYGLIDAYKLVTLNPLTTEFKWSPSNPLEGDEIYFTSTSECLEGEIIKYCWDFDNDGICDANGKSVTHTFDTPGKYNVSLSVETSYGCKDKAHHIINVESRSLHVDFSWSPKEPHAGEKVAFMAEGYDPNGPFQIDFIWDFDGNGESTKNGQTVTHTYLKSGTYRCVLIGISTGGHVGSKSYDIKVLPKKSKSILYF